MRRTIAWLAASLMLPADFALAHPGHGVTDPEGPAHYVLEPLHALPAVLLALAIAGVWAASRLKRQRSGQQKQNDD